MADAKHKGLYLRVASAIILAPLALFAIIYGGWPFIILIGLALSISTQEWSRMADLSKNPALNLLFGLAYIAACITAFSYLRMVHPHGAGLTLALVLAVWGSDIGAYFSGKAIGGPKMAPSISPNKTWAGLIGGLISSAVLFTGYVLYAGPWLTSTTGLDMDATDNRNLLLLIPLGASITLSGQVGDLLISLEKRKVGVKDTGNLIPGHGGILDRIDALLLAALVFVLCVKAFTL